MGAARPKEEGFDGRICFTAAERDNVPFATVKKSNRRDSECFCFFNLSGASSPVNGINTTTNRCMRPNGFKGG